MSGPRRDGSPVWPGGSSLQGPHRVAAFSLCPQLEAYGYELHFRPINQKIAPHVGTLVHAGLAYRYVKMMPEDQWPDWVVYRDGYEAIQALGTIQPWTDLALRIFAAYEEHHRVNVWRPLLVEHQFVVHFSNGEPYSCRTDLLAADAQGNQWIIDHKTCGRPSENLSAKYCTDRQILTNVALARACGYPVVGAIINEVSREQPQPRFQRGVIQLNDSAFACLGRDTLYYLDRIKETREKYPDPRQRPRNTDACQTKYGGTCDFYGLCFGRATEHEFYVPAEYEHGREKRGT